MFGDRSIPLLGNISVKRPNCKIVRSNNKPYIESQTKHLNCIDQILLKMYSYIVDICIYIE